MPIIAELNGNSLIFPLASIKEEIKAEHRTVMVLRKETKDKREPTLGTFKEKVQ